MLPLITLFACATSTPAPEPVASPEPAGAAMTSAAILQAADAHDGTEDHVVSECTGCGLGMKGDPAHASKHEGYELHFCSESCKSQFDAAPEKGVQGLSKALNN